MERFSYTTGNQILTWFVLAVLCIAGVWMVVSTATGQGGPPLYFTVLWLAALGWNVYWWLWRISYRIEVDGDRLRWKTPLRSGRALVGDVESIRPGFRGQTTVLEMRAGRDVICLTRNGISEFVAALTRDRAILVTRSSATGLITFGSQNGFRRDN
jgi:hypothetical protein